MAIECINRFIIVLSPYILLIYLVRIYYYISVYLMQIETLVLLKTELICC
jgi:hypothetical protein